MSTLGLGEVPGAFEEEQPPIASDPISRESDNAERGALTMGHP
jgi:hypothetical protein